MPTHEQVITALVERAEKAEAQLEEANALYNECLRGNQTLRQQVDEINREREEERCAASVLKLKLEGQIDDAVGVSVRAQTHMKSAIERAQKAESEAGRLRTALETVEYHQAYTLSCPWCFRVQELGHRDDCPRQAALRDGDREAKDSAPAIVKTLTNQHGQPFAVYLSDGQKIGIEREGAAAWLRIGPTPIVREAKEGVTSNEV